MSSHGEAFEIGWLQRPALNVDVKKEGEGDEQDDGRVKTGR